MTLPYAEVIGDPIGHSKSPLIHGFWLEQLGIEAEYRRCHVPADELESYFESRRADHQWRGCNVTIPHKQAVQPMLDIVDDKANAIGAVNTIWRTSEGHLAGTNTDIDGVCEAISDLAISQRKVVVIGAGGAARAAFAALASSGAADVAILARTPSKAEIAARDCGLQARVAPIAHGSEAMEGAGLLINATQLGMTGQAEMPPPILERLATLDPQARVFDMVYAPLETELLHAAKVRGLSVADGLTMLIGQAATAFRRFFGQAPPRDRDDELRAMLTS